MRERWEDNYYAMRDGVLETVSFFARLFAGQIIYERMMKVLHGQGTLRYSDDELAAARLEVWVSINALLVESHGQAAADPERGEDDPFWLLGYPHPTEADATVFGFISASLDCKA